MLPEPDWDKIYALASQAEELHEAGQMDRDTWRKLLSEAFEASKGNTDLTTFLAPYAKSAWVRELREEEEEAERRSVA
ncbi:hypothetical protein SBA3_2550013 [Candidatus Sulfopaludibacter sp. SbA3]|nr:hypothetical protein SBA3_2550013 [Candidatus Sulfopaludibacter sp. SbA3]